MCESRFQKSCIQAKNREQERAGYIHRKRSEKGKRRKEKNIEDVDIISGP
jgi:hypothetical protein